ncbi:putative chaperone protein dnaJ 6-like, partial [Capsicum annuum]
MNDSSDREMNERQPQRPSGCVGIFFQLFDRNRIFAKKLFPTKLLSPEMESSKETGCRAPEDPVLCINDCDFFGSAASMNMCSKCQKDMILLKQEHAKFVVASSKDVVRRSSSSDESKLALAGAAVASADLASQISQVKSKEGFKKRTACRKHVGLTGFSCKCGDLFCAVHHYSDKHNCLFNYRNAGQNAIAKANPI